MKLTICQFGKLFLLLTAFLLLNSLKSVGRCEEVAKRKTANTTSVYTETTRYYAKYPINSTFASLAPTITPTTTTSAPPAAILSVPTILKAIKRNAAGITKNSSTAEATKRQRSKSSTAETTTFSKQQQQQKQHHQHQHVGVLVPAVALERMHVQQGFHSFVEFFGVNLQNISVDFLRDDGLSSFIKLLEHPKYTTVVRTLKTGINFDDDLAEGDAMPRGMDVNRTQHEAAAFVHCHLAEELSRDFNKSVLLWPCPRMKAITNSLPHNYGKYCQQS